MSQLSDAVRALLPPEMPVQPVVIKELSSGFQATWGSPVLVKVKVSYKEAQELGWQPVTIRVGESGVTHHPHLGDVPLKLATRLVQAVHAHVTAENEAHAQAAVDAQIAADANGLNVNFAKAEVAAIAEIRGEEKNKLFGERYAADPGAVYRALTAQPENVFEALAAIASPEVVDLDPPNGLFVTKRSEPVRVDTSMGWIARQIATFPEFASHTGISTESLYPAERDKLESWAAKQDGQSGRGEIIRTLLAQEEINSELNEKLHAASGELDTVAEEIETLLEGETPADEMAKRLQKCIERLETAATEARK